MRHQAVADEFVERAAIGEHDAHHPVEIFVELLDELDRVGALGERGKAAQIGEEHGDRLAHTAAERLERALAIVEQLANDVFRNVTLERAPRARAVEPLADIFGDEARAAAQVQREQRRDDGGASVQVIERLEREQQQESIRGDAAQHLQRRPRREQRHQPRGEAREQHEHAIEPQRRFDKEGLVQQRVDRVEVNLGARHDPERRRVLVVRPVSKWPDDDDLAAQPLAIAEICLPISRHEKLVDGLRREAETRRCRVSKEALGFAPRRHELAEPGLHHGARGDGGKDLLVRIGAAALDASERDAETRAPDRLVRLVGEKVRESDAVIERRRLRDELVGGQ